MRAQRLDSTNGTSSAMNPGLTPVPWIDVRPAVQASSNCDTTSVP